MFARDGGLVWQKDLHAALLHVWRAADRVRRVAIVVTTRDEAPILRCKQDARFHCKGTPRPPVAEDQQTVNPSQSADRQAGEKVQIGRGQVSRQTEPTRGDEKGLLQLLFRLLVQLRGHVEDATDSWHSATVAQNSAKKRPVRMATRMFLCTRCSDNNFSQASFAVLGAENGVSIIVWRTSEIAVFERTRAV